MRKYTLTLICLLACTVCMAQFPDKNLDWASFNTYAEANAAVTTSPDVVFMGDSITEFWVKQDPDFFSSHNFLGRGISSQTSEHMLCRFQRDVIELHPKVVVINAGTNDVAHNNGAMLPENTVTQIKSMVELARMHGITPVIASVMPSNKFFWMPDARPAQDIIALNKLIRDYADAAGVIYVDYHSAMSAEDGSLPEKYSADGCHPILAGYKVMESIILPYIEKALKL